MRLEFINAVEKIMVKYLLTSDRSQLYSSIISNRYISKNKVVYYFRFYFNCFDLSIDEKCLVTFNYNDFTNIDDMLYKIDCVPEIQNYLRNKKLDEILNEI